MAQRYTKKDAQKAFENFAYAWRLPIARSSTDEGGYFLDYNSFYGGCVIKQITSPGGSQRDPFGATRRTPREFVEMLWFVNNLYHELKETGKLRL